MKNTNLSYLICTSNRLPFLKILLPMLIENILPEEEIIVIDGNSNDGSKEYIQQLYNENKIHQFVSEKDRNQAHGWNKALLMAKGTIIKKLIDDDVHHLSSIRKCTEFMLANPDIDICVSNHLESHLNTPDNAAVTGRLHEFVKWKNGLIRTFTFSDVSMLLRRSSLSLLGLYDTQFKMMDWEYSLRATYLRAGIAYYTGYNSMAVSTPGNVTSTATRQLLKFEERIGKVKYGYAGDGSGIRLYSRIKIWLGKTGGKMLNPRKTASVPDALPSDIRLREIYTLYYEMLNTYNMERQFDFIC